MTMLPTWVHEFESLEEISRNEGTRRIFLRMAELRRTGRIGTFLTELDDDPEAVRGVLDDQTSRSEPSGLACLPVVRVV